MVKMFVMFLLLATGQSHELVYYKVFNTVGECELGKPEALEAFDAFLQKNGASLDDVKDLKFDCRGEDAVDDEEKAFNALKNTLAEMTRQGGYGTIRKQDQRQF